MRPITISLCQNTWELAKNQRNFSKWVRRQLEREHRWKDVWETLENLTKQNEELQKSSNKWFSMWCEVTTELRDLKESMLVNQEEE